MRFYHFIVLLPSLIIFSTSTVADNLNFNLKNRAFLVKYSHLPVESNAIFSGSLLHHSDNGDLLSGQFHIEQSLYDVNTDLKAGIGARVLFIDANSREGGALALSGSLQYAFPRNSKVSISAALDYAPEVVSFQDLEAFIESNVRFSYQLIDHASAYIGARYVRTDFERSKATTFDSGGFFGISIDL